MTAGRTRTFWIGWRGCTGSAPPSRSIGPSNTLGSPTTSFLTTSTARSHTPPLFISFYTTRMPECMTRTHESAVVSHRNHSTPYALAPKITTNVAHRATTLAHA